MTPASVALRFGETLPAADCSHGRGVTVTLSGVVERLATVIEPSGPDGAFWTSITAGERDSPPSACRAAAAPPAAAFCPSAAPPAPSARTTAPSATLRFITSSSRA